VHFFPGVLDQVWELDGRVQQRSCDRNGIDGCHGRRLLLLLVMLLVVLLMVLLLLVMGVVMVVERMSNGAGRVWLKQRTDAKRLRILGGYRRLAGSYLYHRYDGLWWLRWWWRGGTAFGHVDVRRRQPALHV